jgi:hypothetical protein
MASNNNTAPNATNIKALTEKLIINTNTQLRRASMPLG